MRVGAVSNRAYRVRWKKDGCRETRLEIATTGCVGKKTVAGRRGLKPRLRGAFGKKTVAGRRGLKPRLRGAFGNQGCHDSERFLARPNFATELTFLNLFQQNPNLSALF